MAWCAFLLNGKPFSLGASNLAANDSNRKAIVGYSITINRVISNICLVSDPQGLSALSLGLITISIVEFVRKAPHFKPSLALPTLHTWNY